MKLSKIASAVSFAQLLGLAAAKAEDEDDKKDEKAKNAEDEDDKQRADESDEDYAKRMDEKENDKAKKAEGDDKDDKDKGGDDKDKGKKGKKAEDDSDDGGEAASAERARCAQIIAHGIANGCVRQAGVFAFDTSMSAEQAIKALQASDVDGPRRVSGLRDRMSSVQQTNVGADAGSSAPSANDPRAQADAIILAGKRRRGEA
jgi:hypothetical protein